MQEMNEIEPDMLPGGGGVGGKGGGVGLRISSDRDDRMEAKIKTQKNPCTKI